MKAFFKRYYSHILCILVTAALCTSIGAVLAKSMIHANHGTAARRPEQTPLDTSVQDKMQEIQSYLDHYFIGDIDETAMADSIAEGMIAGTGDRWSYYISADDYDSYMESVNNAYVGIGIVIQLANEDDPGFTIMSVTEGGPAEKAGLQVGDILTKVEGKSVVEMGMEETRNHVRGEEGTKVTITVLRGGVEQEYSVERANIAVVNVRSEMLTDEIGYISIDNFDSNCARDSIAAIESLQSQGAKKLIFDVRFNPGGFKSELVELLDYILPEGKLFISEDYSGEETVDYSDADCLDMEIAVLVNGDSYSAAEFFAAALKEYGVAQVVGTQTCGKGYFQTTFPLSDGSAIAISIGKYRTPNGVSLAEVGGLVPDQVIELDQEDYEALYYDQLSHKDDPQLEKAIEVLSN